MSATALSISTRPSLCKVLALFQINARKAFLPHLKVHIPKPTFGLLSRLDKKWRPERIMPAPNVQKTSTPRQPQGRGPAAAAPTGGKGGGGSGRSDDPDDLDLLHSLTFHPKGHGLFRKMRSWLGRIVDVEVATLG